MPWCGLSPAELLMGRRIRTDVPQQKKMFVPNWPHMRDLNELDRKYKLSQKQNFDECHRVKQLSPLPDDLPVWVETRLRENRCQGESPGRQTHLGHIWFRCHQAKSVGIAYI